MTKFYRHTISKQIFGSNWYAHYKFFHEMEKSWLEQELNLSFKDKSPLSLRIWTGIIIMAFSVYVFLSL